MSITTVPPTFYEFAFNAPPNQAALPPFWQDLSSRVQFPWTVSRGRQYELDTNETGAWNMQLANPDGALDPSNAASPFAPNLMLYRGCRIRCRPGNNILTPDQATCGQATGYLPGPGPLPAQMGVTNDFGYTLSLAASGTAYTGSQVYQATLPSGSTQFTTVLIIPVVSIVPGQTYTASAQVRIPSGSTVACAVGLVYYSAAGVQLAAGPGSPQTITSGSGTWVTVSTTTQAPGASTPAAYCYLKVYINATIGSATTVQVGALQLENSATATPWQAPYTVSNNLLPQPIATGTASISPVSDTPANWFYADSGSLAQATFLTAAPPGQTTALAWTTPPGTTSNSRLYVGGGQGTITSSGPGPIADTIQVTGSTAYTGSVYLTRATSADASVQMTAGFRWYDINGNLLSTSVGSAVTVATGGTWVRATCTATAPATAAWCRMRIFISSPASTTATNTIYAAAWQVEANAAASTWVDPGPVYFVFTGSYERMPQTWTEQEGTYGTAQPIGVDAFAGLAQPTLLEPFLNEVLALGPSFFYPLNEPAGSSLCVDIAGKRNAAPVENSPGGVGSLVFGSSITSAVAGQAFIGSSGPVATFANNPSDPSSGALAETFVSVHKTTVTPGPPPNGSWTRIIHFRCPTAPTTGNAYSIWEALPPTFLGSGNTSAFNIGIAAGTSEIDLLVWGSTGSLVTNTNTTSYCDGNWHQAAITVDGSGNVAMYMDGASVPTSAAAITLPISGCTSDAIGTSVQFGAQTFRSGMVGDIACAIELPFAATAAQVSNLYNSWRTASTGDGSGARYQRVLNWVGYSGPTHIDTGSTASMGPATDNAGASGLDALNNVALTENGDQYASNSGVLTFKARSARYNQRNPMFVFGEGSPVGNPGEWPCEISQIEYDPSLLGNNIQVTQYSTNTIFYANDPASKQNYYPRTYQRTVNTSSSSEPQDAANYLLSQYKDPHLRTDVIRLHPSAVPGLMNVCLQLEKGTRIRVIRRPDGAPTITTDCFVEHIDWAWDPNAGDVVVEIQASPANLVAYWQLAALHTTLNATANSGQNQIKINALPDSAVNPLAASLPQSQQLVIDPGTAIAETVTIAPPLPATNIGYSTATLTLTANLANTHQANAVVCEVLPTGYTDPTTWDTASVLGAASTTVVSSTSNTVTVNPLIDAKSNPIAADWNIGDLIWISPGTPNFQGLNLLTPNVSTAGGGVLPLAAGTLGTGVGLGGAAGTPVVTASGSAFQGSTVWQTSVAANQATPSGTLFVNKVAGTPLLPFTASAYVRSATSGANPSMLIYIEYLSATGTVLGSTNSSTTTLTGSPTAAWTRMSVTATAPAGTVWIQVGVVLTGTAPSIAWLCQHDALQLEQNSSASTYQTCPQISAISSTVAGYTTATITLPAAMPFTPSVGDWVCDPLPPGTTNPTAIAATTRRAY